MAVGPSTDYPFTLSIADCCAMWWKVKDWSLSFTLEYFRDLFPEEPAGSYWQMPPTNYEFTFRPAVTGSGNSNYMSTLSEKFLVCWKEIEQAAFVAQKDLDQNIEVFIATDPPTENNFVLTDAVQFVTNYDNQSDGFHNPFARLEEIDSLYQSHFWVATQLQIGEFVSKATNDTFDASFQMHNSSGALVEKGLIRMGRVLESGFQTVTSAVLKPIEYWPYDPGDGKGPIYDSVTGAQLRGFPS